MIKNALQFFKRTLTRPQGLDLDAVHPVSEWMGEDRGTPVDRYYIERFLSLNRSHIHGKVIEVASSKYIDQFGVGVTQTDVLHPIKGTPRATVIGDLTNPDTLPENVYDCFVCTQTFHVIYNYMDAIRGAYKMLKPGGVLLCTLGGIAQISAFDMDRWGDYWRFTTQSAQRSFNEVFGAEHVLVDAFGNCLTAVSMLRGIATEEIKKEKLDFKDRNYPVIVTVLATKQ